MTATTKTIRFIDLETARQAADQIELTGQAHEAGVIRVAVERIEEYATYLRHLLTAAVEDGELDPLGLPGLTFEVDEVVA